MSQDESSDPPGGVDFEAISNCAEDIAGSTEQPRRDTTRLQAAVNVALEDWLSQPRRARLAVIMCMRADVLVAEQDAATNTIPAVAEHTRALAEAVELLQAIEDVL